jgi:division protein CdvB (Snf7/Vps24/ESCRT-III family)
MGNDPEPPKGKPDPLRETKEKFREIDRKMVKSVNGIKRQITEMKRSETKAVNEIKQVLKRGDTASAKILGKELIRIRNTEERYFTSTSQLTGLRSELKHQLGQAKVSQAVKSSTEVMQAMNALMKNSEIHDVYFHCILFHIYR